MNVRSSLPTLYLHCSPGYRGADDIRRHARGLRERPVARRERWPRGRLRKTLQMAMELAWPEPATSWVRSRIAGAPSDLGSQRMCPNCRVSCLLCSGATPRSHLPPCAMGLHMGYKCRYRDEQQQGGIRIPSLITRTEQRSPAGRRESSEAAFLGETAAPRQVDEAPQGRADSAVSYVGA